MAVHQLLRGRAKLGAVNIGGGGTIRKLDVGTVVLNPGSATTNSVVVVTFTLTGAAVGDVVVVNPPAAIEAGLIATAFVSAANTVTVRVANITAGTVDAASATWSYVWFDRT